MRFCKCLEQLFEPLQSNYNILHDFDQYKDVAAYSTIKTRTRKLKKTNEDLENNSNESEHNDVGYCAIFSLWYALKRMEYQHLTRDEFQNTIFLKMKNLDINKYINNYTNHIIQKLHDLADKYHINYQQHLKDDLLLAKKFNKMKDEDDVLLLLI